LGRGPRDWVIEADDDRRRTSDLEADAVVVERPLRRHQQADPPRAGGGAAEADLEYRRELVAPAIGLDRCQASLEVRDSVLLLVDAVLLPPHERRGEHGNEHGKTSEDIAWTHRLRPIWPPWRTQSATSSRSSTVPVDN